MGKRFVDPQETWPGHCLHCGAANPDNGDVCGNCGENPYEPQEKHLIEEEAIEVY